MTIYIILAIIIATLLICLWNIILHKDGLSFKESLEILQLPIVTFNYGEDKLHMIIDTGSTYSFLAPSVFEKMTNNNSVTNCQANIGGVGGDISSSTQIMDVCLKYRNKNLKKGPFMRGDCLIKQFSYLNKKHSIEIHGLIGSDFLELNKFIIDYKELKVYSKRRLL